MNIQITCWECDFDHSHAIPASQAGLEVETVCPQCDAMNIVEVPLEDEAPMLTMIDWRTPYKAGKMAAYSHALGPLETQYLCGERRRPHRLWSGLWMEATPTSQPHCPGCHDLAKTAIL